MGHDGSRANSQEAADGLADWTDDDQLHIHMQERANGVNAGN